MSFDYFIAVPRANWPTAAAVQASLEKLGYPLALLSASRRPFALPAGDYSLPVLFEGRDVELEADIEQWSAAEGPESIFGYIAETVASEFRISDGDYFLTLTFRSDADQIRTGLLLAAALIQSFGGYGFENQFETHGGLNFAARLVAEARKPFASRPKGVVE